MLLATRHAERLARLVLTNCDACDDFPPVPFKGTPQLVRVPGAGRLIAEAFRLAAVRRIGARLLTKHGIPDQVLEGLRDFDRPTLLAWAPEDRIFKRGNAERLVEAIPNARLELIADSKAFTQEDQPERLAELIRSFVRTTASGAASA